MPGSSFSLHLYLKSVVPGHALGPGSSLHPQKQIRTVNAKPVSTHTCVRMCVHQGLPKCLTPTQLCCSLARLIPSTVSFTLSFFPEPLQKEVQSMAFLEVVSKLRSHENKTVAQQASLTEQRLAVES